MLKEIRSVVPVGVGARRSSIVRRESRGGDSDVAVAVDEGREHKVLLERMTAEHYENSRETAEDSKEKSRQSNQIAADEKGRELEHEDMDAEEVGTEVNIEGEPRAELLREAGRRRTWGGRMPCGLPSCSKGVIALSGRGGHPCGRPLMPNSQLASCASCRPY